MSRRETALLFGLLFSIGIIVGTMHRSPAAIPTDPDEQASDAQSPTPSSTPSSHRPID